jgi:hypothetical protein
MATKKLSDFLNPKGNLNDSTKFPDVLDSDNNILPYSSVNRKTTESTVVDLGDSPNSNTGDPLRLAFIKINNFMEASYWSSQNDAKEFDDIKSRLTLTETNSGTSFPAAPKTGRLWYRTDTSTLYLYGGATQGWVDLGIIYLDSGTYRFKIDGGTF